MVLENRINGAVKMKAKTIVTIALVAFVIASVAYVILKDKLSGSSDNASPCHDTTLVCDSMKTQIADSTKPDSTKTVAVPNANPKQTDPTASKAAEHVVMVYYLHGSARCANCITIEKFTDKAMKTGFAKELQNGAVRWKVLNIEDKGNEHFVQDYQLYTKSVIVSDMRGGKQTQWKNLAKVWDLLDDETAFVNYIQTEVKSYLAVK
jgi:hypothetical protein